MGGTGRHARIRVMIDPIESTELADSYLPDLAASKRAWRS
jgi:hypothetical protein